MKRYTVIALLFVFAIVGYFVFSKSDPNSVAYYMEHKDKRLARLEACGLMDVLKAQSDEDCLNAAQAQSKVRMKTVLRGIDKPPTAPPVKRNPF